LAPLALAGLFFAREAAAEIPLCVEVSAPEAEIQSFRKLVNLEVDRHPSHRAVKEGCRSRLTVDLFDAGGTRFLTAQIDREVPMRFVIKDPVEVAPRIEEAIRLVLHNDPAYLVEDVAHLSAVQRLGRSILVQGRFTFRLEVFETLARGSAGMVTVPGAAFSLTRGSGNWHVLGRVYAGVSLSPVTGTERALQTTVGLDAGLSYEFLAKAFWTPYISGGAGVQFVRYAGREHKGDTVLTHVNDLGPSLSARVGARFFRFHNFDFDLFAQGYLPLFLTRDVDGALFGDKGLYAPSMHVGLGVGF
jgi:hypothetical protein